MNEINGKKRKFNENETHFTDEDWDQRSEQSNSDRQSIDEESDDMNRDNEESDEELGDNNDEEEEDNEKEMNGNEEPVVKKSKTKKSPKEKTPTAQELNNLRETEALFHSSLFRLQLNEMLTEVKLKEKRLIKMNKWLKQLEALLLSLESQTTRDLTDQSWLRVKAPLIQEPFDVKGIFRFEAPKVVKVLGSYALGTAIGSGLTIDIAVEMPNNCWQRDDCLNQRYHRKRALYLCQISQMIQSNELISDLKFTYFNGNHMKPILLIKPNAKIAKYCNFALFVCPENSDKCFKMSRFLPEKNNVRSDWMTMDDSEDLPTPVYNSSIQTDVNLISNFEYLLKNIENSTNIKDSIILLKVWLKQREMRSSLGFILSLFVCYLIENRKISRNSSCYQIFRNTLLAIMNSKWDSEGITLCKESTEPMEKFLFYFPVVFTDPTGGHNLCWDISIDLYERLKHESMLTIESLDSNEANSFESVFMKQITFETKFDALLRISIPSLLECSKVNEISSDIIDQSGDTVSAFISHLIPLCKRILGNRVELLQHKPKSSVSIEWSTDCLPPNPNDSEFVTFGLLIDPENAYNAIERGPSADTEEAKAFRDFWGKKSELRRFQDGSICETVYWSVKTFSDKRKIIEHSIEFILINILNIPKESIIITISNLDPILELPNLEFENKDIVYGTGEEPLLSIAYSFDNLAKRLRTLDSLPLTVTSVQGISPVFRGTEVFPSIPMNSGKSNFVNNCNIFEIKSEHRVHKYFKPLEVIIGLEGSGKWPSDAKALQRVKASFHIELSKQLNTKYGLISYPNSQFVDVFQDGFIFRIIISCHKEITILRQIKTSEGIVKNIDSEEANRLELKTEILPKINSALNSINKQHLCYGIVCRLVKRWIDSQMLGQYFDDIVVELLIANIYLKSFPFTTPNSPMTGFLRFLFLICEHNWKITPLIVNLNNDLSDEKLTEITSLFTSDRPKYPSMFITSPYDNELSVWTKSSPTASVLNRLLTLANAAKDSLLLQINSNQLTKDLKFIFRPDLDIYDVIINLKSEQITNQMQAIDFPNIYKFTVKQFNPELDVNEKMPIIGFDPIEKYLKVLRLSYSEFALFFYDRFGGRKIGVLWKPTVFESNSFKISQIKGVLLSSMSAKHKSHNVLTNIEAIIEDFYIIGDQIVSSIESRTEKWDHN